VIGFYLPDQIDHGRPQYSDIIIRHGGQVLPSIACDKSDQAWYRPSSIGIGWSMKDGMEYFPDDRRDGSLGW